MFVKGECVCVCACMFVYDQDAMSGGVGSLRAQRLLTAASQESPDKVEHISRELWMRVWSRVSSCNHSDCTHMYVKHCSTHPCKHE